MTGPIEVRMPKYPDCWETCGSCASGEVVALDVLVKPGDLVDYDQPVLTLETGKTTLDIPSPRAGRVAGVFVAAGDAIAEGQLLITLLPAASLPA
ncbi:MAG: dihydrolipoamide acyltransferase [Zoogloeaceae bacterium]|nr:dihydrolipoamide acyltransferase [Zoogloeaceae bacterium]